MKAIVESKYFPSVRRDHYVTVLHVDPPGLIPIQKMDCGRRRPMRDREVIEDDAFTKINCPELIRMGHDRRFWKQSLRELRLPEARWSVQEQILPAVGH